MKGAEDRGMTERKREKKPRRWVVVVEDRPIPGESYFTKSEIVWALRTGEVLTVSVEREGTPK